MRLDEVLRCLLLDQLRLLDLLIQEEIRDQLIHQIREVCHEDQAHLTAEDPLLLRPIVDPQTHTVDRIQVPTHVVIREQQDIAHQVEHRQDRLTALLQVQADLVEVCPLAEVDPAEEVQVYHVAALEEDPEAEEGEINSPFFLLK